MFKCLAEKLQSSKETGGWINLFFGEVAAGGI